MNRKRFFLMVGLGVLWFSICRASPMAELRLEAGPLRGQQSTPTPVETTAEILTAAPSSTPQSDSKSKKEFPAQGEACLAEKDGLTLDIEVLLDPDFDQQIAEYLNGGGNALALEELFSRIIVSGEPYIVQVHPFDFTADGILDILMVLNIPYGNGLGEAHVLAFHCDEGRYQSEIIFRRAGVGSRAEGLYEGGGAAIEALQDFNANQVSEIFFAVHWPNYVEYYLLDWQEGTFGSLIEYVDALGMQKYRLEVVHGGADVIDIEGDGIYEIEVGGIDMISGNQTTIVWRWDGDFYLPEEDEPN